MRDNWSIPGFPIRLSGAEKTQTKGAPMAKRRKAMQSLISDFTRSALERSQEMTEREFERTVKESHEIIDRQISLSGLIADS